MDPCYSKIGAVDIRVVEECSEVTQEICKARRFGWFNHHPDDVSKTPNLKRVQQELRDLKRNIEQLEDFLYEMEATHESDTAKSGI